MIEVMRKSTHFSLENVLRKTLVANSCIISNPFFSICSIISCAADRSFSKNLILSVRQKEQCPFLVQSYSIFRYNALVQIWLVSSSLSFIHIVSPRAKWIFLSMATLVPCGLRCLDF